MLEASIGPLLLFQINILNVERRTDLVKTESSFSTKLMVFDHILVREKWVVVTGRKQNEKVNNPRSTRLY